ncbi:MAG: hypothetical protein GY771_10435 [bacterium]|nr:hypothetical protein [bacterium]
MVVVFVAQDRCGLWLRGFGKAASNSKKGKGRHKPLVDAKALFYCGAVIEMKILLTDLARKLEMTISGIGYTAQRGEDIALH